MTIRLNAFQGEFPKTSPRLLPENAAQIAENVRLEDGALIPYMVPSVVHTFGSSVTSIYLNGASWLGWATEGVKAAPGPIADDRLYIFGDGAPKLLHSGTTYGLALSAPGSAPDAEIQASTARTLLGVAGASQRYEFDGTNWGLADAVAEVTLALDQVVAARDELTVRFSGDANTPLIVALLPVSPAAGDAIAIQQQGSGRVHVHRNGETIEGSDSDTALTASGDIILALFHGSDWLIRAVGDAAQTITDDTSIGAGSHVFVNSSSNVTLDLPTSPAVGDVVSAERLGTGNAKFDAGPLDINGAGEFTIPNQNERWAVIFNGTEWRAFQLKGAYGADYLSFNGNTVLTANKSYRGLPQSAPKVALVDLPAAASTGHVVKVARTGTKPVLVLPNGRNVAGVGLPYEIATDNTAFAFTLGGAGWTAAADTSAIPTRANLTAPADATVLAYGNMRDITIRLPASPSTGDFVEVHALGAYSVYVHPNGEAIYLEPDEDTAEDVLFAYTWVTSLDEESKPSPVTDALLWSADLPVMISGFGAPPSGRLVDRIRIYRSQTSASGSTDLYFLAEIPVATTSWLYVEADTPLGEIVPSNDYDAPPSALRGVVTMPNGIMAAHRGRRLAFCEPYVPHAWPAKYELSVDYQIVGLAAFGSILAVMTTGTPYIVQGTQPDTMAIEKVEAGLPCVSADGIVDMGYAAAYPSPEGLVLIQPSGATVVTRGLFTRQQWQALNPSSFKAGSYAGRYVFSYQQGGARKCGIIDLSGEQPFFVQTTIEAESMFTDPRTGNLYLLADGTIVGRWDGSTTPLPMRWKSKEFRTAQPLSYAAMKVEIENRAIAPDRTILVNVYANTALLHGEVMFGTATRLPPVLADSWEVEIIGTLPISMVTIAESMVRLSTG